MLTLLGLKGKSVRAVPSGYELRTVESPPPVVLQNARATGIGADGFLYDEPDLPAKATRHGKALLK